MHEVKIEVMFKLSDAQCLKRHMKLHFWKKTPKHNEQLETRSDDTEILCQRYSIKRCQLNFLQLVLCRKSPRNIKESTQSADLIAFLDEELPPPLPYSCTECRQSFSAECDLKLHKSTHVTSEIYLCMACQKQFASKLIAHI